MAQYRKKPVVIEAIQWLGEKSFDELFKFTDADNNYGIVGMKDGKGDIAQIRTLEGIMDANPNDFIIKGVNGEFYPCKPDIFEKTYDSEVTTFKERLIKEQEELNDKITTLYEFGSTEKFKELDPIHQRLLIIQSGAMITYNETLKLSLGLL